MRIGVFGGLPLLAFGLLVGTRIGRVISLILFAMVVVRMINPSPDERAAAMKAGTFDCTAALNEAIEDDSWAYCSGAYGEAQWTAMVNAKLADDAAAQAKREADDQAQSDAKEAGPTALGQRAALSRPLSPPEPQNRERSHPRRALGRVFGSI
jgi:hypothetical protein